MQNHAQRPNLIFVPPEIRQLIYIHLFNDLSIRVQTFKAQALDLSSYSWQISATSRLLRQETLPFLQSTTSTSKLKLICEEGRFPDNVRRRLPDRVFKSIHHITILDNIYHDQLKPSRRTFPNLAVLEFDLKSVDDNPYTGILDSYHGIGSGLPLAMELSRNVRRKLRYMEHEQSMPREGLERDYWPEGTLWQVINMDRRKRGFDIVAKQRCIGFYSPLTVVELDLENPGLDRL